MSNENWMRAKVERFHRRHGGICYCDFDESGQPTSHYYYPDGAYRDVDLHGVLAEPWDTSTPEGEHRNAENIVTFHRLKLKKSVKDFDDWDYRLSVMPPADPDDEKDALDKKRELAAIVRQCKQELAWAEEQRDSTEIGRRRKELQEAEYERRERFHDFQKKRSAIRV